MFHILLHIYHHHLILCTWVVGGANDLFTITINVLFYCNSYFIAALVSCEIKQINAASIVQGYCSTHLCYFIA